MTGRLQDKVAIVTGAARGIGAAIARVFAREGAELALFDLDEATLAGVVREVRTSDRSTALPIRLDITDRPAVEAAVRVVLERFGRIDILVNNAGINVFGDPLTTTDEAWRRSLAVNLDGAWHLTRAVLPDMLKRSSGSIVNIASTHAFSIIPGCFPYPVAKHGLIGLTRSLAIEYAPRGIRINAIAPGYIETEKVRDWLEGHEDPAAARARVENLIPARRIGRPEEVAFAAVYLASDEAAFSIGSILTMDGGRSVVYHD
jgi:NAD(P)-dependent dehydrogenase (short-subunit alcohol dehydrogenase family)